MLSDESIKNQLESNLGRFITFRLFYSARFYYPVLTVLFLDYGLSLEQFGILNLVWALTIVCAEVPSGAMADIVGRKRLLIFAAALMVVEMALLVFVPLGASPLLFWVFLANRICSGLSEAAASGADEALAYDSLKALGREGDWAKLLETTTRVVSIGFFSTMILGAFVYDGAMVNSLLNFLHEGWEVSETLVIRLPIVLTLLSSIVVLATSLRFYDIDKSVLEEAKRKAHAAGENLSTIRESFTQILRAANWTLGHRFVLFVILAALALDSVARQFVVLASEYYRSIEISVSWFGVIGAGMSLIGIVNARLANLMVHRISPFHNFILLSLLLVVSLVGLMLAIPLYGVLFAVGAFSILGLVQYQASYYINNAVDSKIRATVLSFKGLALNLGLGVASLLYTGFVSVLKAGKSDVLAESVMQREVFIASLGAFPIYYLCLFVGIVILGSRLLSLSALAQFKKEI